MFRQLSPLGPGVLRFTLSWLVVVSHTAPLCLGDWAVYLFFTLSGFWIASMWNEKYSLCKNPYLTFIVSRYWRILPLFLACNAIAAVTVFFMPQWWPERAGEIFHFSWWLRAALLAGSSKQYLLLIPAWSLDVEMIFYIIAPFLVTGGVAYRWIGHAKMPLFIATLIIALLCLWLFAGVKTGRNLSFFFTGVLAYQCQWRPSRMLALSSGAIFVGIIALAACFPSTRAFVWRATEWSSELPNIRLYLAVVATFISIPFAIYTVHSPFSKTDRTLGDMAYAVYIFHWVILQIPRSYLGYDLSEPAILLAQYSVILLCSGLLYRYLERPSERLRRSFVSARKGESNKLKSHAAAV
jgi:peptidoglycan/LPS O-acetylase OafA/YrhL